MATITLDGLDQLARQYDKAPVEPSRRARALWTKAGEYFVARAETLGERFDIWRWETGQPYDNGAEQLADLDKGRFIVTAEHSEHPIWDVDTNVAFRICHDIDGHYAARSGFDLLGEVEAYTCQTLITPAVFEPVLWSESILQLASTLVNGSFPVQKAVL